MQKRRMVSADHGPITLRLCSGFGGLKHWKERRRATSVQHSSIEWGACAEVQAPEKLVSRLKHENVLPLGGPQTRSPCRPLRFEMLAQSRRATGSHTRRDRRVEEKKMPGNSEAMNSVACTAGCPRHALQALGAIKRELVKTSACSVQISTSQFTHPEPSEIFIISFESYDRQYFHPSLLVNAWVDCRNVILKHQISYCI